MPHENRAAGDAERSPAPLFRDDAPKPSVVADIVDTTASELDAAGAAEPPMDADEKVLDDEMAADDEADNDEADNIEADDLGPTFAELGLQPEILRALSDMGYERPMKVQQVVYGDMIAGRDVMVQSRTGSGKTAGFGIPIVQHIASDQRGARALILAPTRELARQVAREIGQLAVHKGLTVEAIYGGAPIKPQMDALAAGAQIIAGTPGRVLDHLRRGTLKPGEIRQLILDECDEMLSMGFQEEIENIIEFLPPKEERQTVLFSATIPDEIQRIARRHLTEPAEHQLSLDGVSVSEIDHYYYVVSGMARTRDLLGVLKAEQPEAAIIFCNTREDTNTVSKFLRSQGYDAEAISSDLVQRDRERVMKRMRDRNLHFLVATDVAARGIDISNLSHVINYTFPESPEVYVHRTGRTGRAGNSGVAISLIGPRELGSFYYLKLIYQIRPEERDLPTSAEMEVLAEGERYERVLSLVDEDAAHEYSSLARRLWQSGHGERVVGALLARLLTGKPGREAASRAAASERGDGEPRRDRDSGRRGSSERGRRDHDGRRSRSRDGDERDSRGRGDGDDRDSRRGRARDDDSRGRRARGGRDGDDRSTRRGSRRRDRDGDERGRDEVQAERDTETSERDARRSRRREDSAERSERRRSRRRREEPSAAAETSESASDAAADEVRPAEEPKADESERRSRQQADREQRRERREERRQRRSSGKDEVVEADSGADEPQPDASPPDSAPKRAARTSKRKRNASNGRKAPATDGTKEFWETWADEKAERDAEPADEPTPAAEADATDRPAAAKRSSAAKPAASRSKTRRRGARAAAETSPEQPDGDASDNASSRKSEDTPTRLYVNVGRREGLTAADVRALLGEGMAAEDAKRIGSVAMRNTHCYVRVPEELAAAIIDNAADREYEDRELVIEVAHR